MVADPHTFVVSVCSIAHVLYIVYTRMSKKPNSSPSNIDTTLLTPSPPGFHSLPLASTRVHPLPPAPTRKIHAPDLNEALKALGRRCTKKEIEDMIWEVDENLDGCVDWEEFRLMFQRNITDTTGLEVSGWVYLSVGVGVGVLVV